jgi:hypothetical protein
MINMTPKEKLQVKINNFLLFFICFGLPFLIVLGILGIIIITHDPNHVNVIEWEEPGTKFQKGRGWYND